MSYYDWPYYFLHNGWLITPNGTDNGLRCPQQATPFPIDFTAAEAEQWLKDNDIRGTVQGG